ncbi:P-type conjugative transfer protein TrbL, partial [Brevundimonas sp.]|uniref:P-type conjugative transfer protein TrbL n=1 Tax=Brevundimonas sp. TaxID=1871086 RepID=UPI003D6D09FF
MNDTGVIDRFFEVFSRYIDSGFGLLGGEVAFVATTLIVIDVTLAALFWAWGPSDDILARLVKKTLFVGFFAFLIGNFQRLSEIVFASFARLGLKASGSNLSSEDFLRPGKLAQEGIDAGRPMLTAAAEMSGFPGFFENFVQIAILMVAFLIVLIAFFIMAVQLFVTLIEFKLTSLAGFVLIPFGLFGKTAFLAERVLGNVVASGVKVLVLAVIVGIGSTMFDTFVKDFAGQPPALEDVLAITLAALSLAGLAIFGPGIASGLISGAPQLSAGAAIGTGLAVGGVAMAGVASARLAASAGAGLAGR